MALAFIFPGQGSQSVGMLGDLASKHPEVMKTFQQASAALGYDLWRIVQDGPESELNKTHITQPAMLTADIAVWRAWQSASGQTPAIMAGHSLGEYSALVAAGSLSLEDAVTLVAERGRFMQEAIPEGAGAMAAILGIEDAAVIDVCAQAAQGDIVSAVNFNSPGQIVIAGHTAAVERAVSLAKEAGAKRAIVLPVSVPSHCALMKPAAVRLAQLLASIHIASPVIPVINNVDVKMETTPDAIRDALVRQLYCPVRWVETIQALTARGVKQVVECGPGKVLAGLNKRIDRDMACHAIFDSDSLSHALNSTRGEI